MKPVEVITVGGHGIPAGMFKYHHVMVSSRRRAWLSVQIEFDMLWNQLN